MKSIFLLLLLFSSPLLADGWAQKTLELMPLDEKIGQLFLIAAYVDPDYARQEIGNPGIIEEIDEIIEQIRVGGLAFVGPSECVKQAALTNRYQSLSKIPLLVAQDLEWGLSMRHKDGMRFPKNCTLGAVSDDRLIYEMGREVGRQAKLIGVHMNLSPVLDVNNEPENLAINVRSFGASPELVARKGIAMIRGLQDAGIIASAKHFPGLGDISIDPHLGLPSSSHGMKRLQEVELIPFVQAIEAGVLSIQTEHLLIPALEPDWPSSLSRKIVEELLKKEMGFMGLVLSGALRMKALVDHFSHEEIVLKAFLAGNDMLLMPQDVQAAHRTIRTAVEAGIISEEEIDARVLKILQMKERVGLDREKIVALPTVEQLQTPDAKALKEKLYRNAVAVVRDPHRLLPSDRSIAYVQLGEAPSPNFREQLPIDCDSLEKASLVILAIYPEDPRRIEKIRLLDGLSREKELKQFRVHGLSRSMIESIDDLQRYEQKTVVVYFGNPFGLHFFDGYSTLLMAYEPDADAERAAADLLVKSRDR